jgi:Tfp pilus assembly protein PilX
MTRTRLTDLRAEDGIAIVVAVLLMAIMLMMGLGAMSLVDGQSKLTAKQRQRETSFNISEAALNAQITQISHHWPGKNGATEPGVAFSACPGGTYCPGGNELTSLVPGADSNVAVTWKTNVYDNNANLSGFFADSRVVGTPCGCDENGDGKMWVRAQATVRGKTRVVVSLVQQQMQAESVPHAAIIAGALTITNNGNHGQPIIDANGGIVGVRCEVPPGAGSGGPPESSSAPCLGQPLGVAPTKTDAAWDDLLNQQIDGFQTSQQKYSPAPVFTQDQVDRFIATARAQSTYYTGCPSSLAGAVVVINTTGTCSYTGNAQWNTKADPGFLLLLNANSALSLNGGVNYYGVIYHENAGTPPTLGSAPQSTATLISVHGNAKVIGGVIIDGMGRMEIGSSGSQESNIEFDDHGYDAVQSYAGAGIIQNSWREIQPGQ